MSEGWIGVDLDGTLAYHTKPVQWDHIGIPIKPMVIRINRWLDEGKIIKIFTARVSFEKAICYVTGQEFTRDMMTQKIQDYCDRNVRKGWRPECTALKDVFMIELWDDRCIQVKANSGEPIGYLTRGL